MTSYFDDQLDFRRLFIIERVWEQGEESQRRRVGQEWTYRKGFHGSYVFLGRFRRIVVRVIELATVEVPRARVSKSTPKINES